MEDEDFIQNNLGLVHLCANKFRNKGIEYEEMFSAGCIGLVKAMKAFDPSRNVKFSTYAVPVILGEIKCLFRDGGSIKVSRKIKSLSIHISRERDRFLKNYGREPTISELSEILNVSEAEIAEAVSAGLPTVSLTCEDDEGCSQLDIPVEAPDIKITDRVSLHQIISTLEPDDRQLIFLRYYRNLTQVQTAKLLGITQVKVSRREKKILSVIREKMLG